MKHQQVSVDYWQMGKTMLTYGLLTGMLWMMLRLFGAVFTLPRRLRAQQNTMKDTLRELQKRYPDMNITEEDLKEAEKEFEDLMKEKQNKSEESSQQSQIEDKEDPVLEEYKSGEDKKSI